MTRMHSPSYQPISPRPVKKSLIILCRLAAVAAVISVPCGRPACASSVGIQGTMSNFDVFNETGNPVYGAELDLEGVTPSEVMKTYPSHFSNMTATDYGTGTRLVFTGYNFGATGYIIPRVGQTTNGHYAVNQPGCEHFGFSVSKQPTATKFYWLDNSTPARQVTAPLSIPQPTWTYVPAVGAAPPVMQAVLAPVPPPPAVQWPDAVWVKTFVTEMTRQVDLEELISAPAANQVAPQLPSQVEAEWELLPGDAPLAEPDIQIAEADQSILRRYEYYQYTGTYDEVHLPNSLFTGGTPDPAELGQFIAANMVAANLDVVPEPSTLALLFTGLGVSIWMARRRWAS